MNDKLRNYIAKESNPFRRQGYLDAIVELGQPEKPKYQRGNYKRSPEQRKRQSEAMRASWAKKREQEKTTLTAV